MAKNDNLISLRKASQKCEYSQEYLSLRARQGKLRAVKKGRKWMTTPEWITEYIAKVEDYKEKMREDKKPKNQADTLDEKIDNFLKGSPEKEEEFLLDLPKADFRDIEEKIEEISQDNQVRISHRADSGKRGFFSFILALALLTIGVVSAKEDISRVFIQTDSYVSRVGQIGSGIITDVPEVALQSFDNVFEDIETAKSAVILEAPYSASVFHSFSAWLGEETKRTSRYVCEKIGEGAEDIGRGSKKIGEGISQFLTKPFVPSSGK